MGSPFSSLGLLVILAILAVACAIGWDKLAGAGS